MFIQAQCASLFMQKFRDAGYEKGIGAPLMLQREIANYFNHNYFINGQFDYEEGLYFISTKKGRWEIKNSETYLLISNQAKNFDTTTQVFFCLAPFLTMTGTRQYNLLS